MAKAKLIVFEGPDMCGKTTHIQTVVDKLKEKGYRATSVKFPVYDGYDGYEILDHLKNFDIEKYYPECALAELDRESVRLYANKLLERQELEKLAKSHDIIVLDRFNLSQYAYDIAWCNALYSEYIKHNLFDGGLFKIRIKEYHYDAMERAAKVYEYFSEVFDIEYVIFDRSDVISHVVMASKAIEEENGRRIDSYDSNIVYQTQVAKVYSFVNQLKKFYETNGTVDKRGVFKFNWYKSFTPYGSIEVDDDKMIKSSGKQSKKDPYNRMCVDRLMKPLCKKIIANIKTDYIYISRMKAMTFPIEMPSDIKNDVMDYIDNEIVASIIRNYNEPEKTEE